MGQFNRNDYDRLVLNEVRDGTVAAAFTERTGGISESPYASLNLGSHVGDDLAAVMENRRRVLAALGCADDFERLLVPNQVHGDCVAVVREGSDDELARVREQIAEGSDAIVCVAAHVPVMLCFADCVPVVLTCPGGFAVIHSGWKGTIARISAKAAGILCETAACPADSVRAYIGPHILGDEYEVSQELMERFCAEFGWVDTGDSRMLDLGRAIRQALVETGVPEDVICDLGLSTVRCNDRFFSYRTEKGTCGRHAAVAVMV